MVEQPLGRRERKKLEVRRRIRRAAAKLFAEKGYDAATVDEISELADVSKGTFFNYFPRKDSLLMELSIELFDDVEGDLGPSEAWRGSRREQLVRFYGALGERVHRDPQLFKVMIGENVRNLWMGGDEEPERRLRGVTRRLLEEAVEGGEFPPGSDLDAGMRLIEAAYATATIESLRTGTLVTEYRRVLTTRLNIIFRGLGGEPVRMEGSGS
ncbi:MAG: TetR/AcrR family transcriptional regulator [Gemmatimonadota bacterium]